MSGDRVSIADARQTVEALETCYENGLIRQPRLNPNILQYQDPRDNPQLLQVFDQYPTDPRRNDRITDQLSDPAMDTRIQDYQDNSFVWDYPAGGFGVYTSYELARFVTRQNETGIVKLLWTYVELEGEVENSFLDLPWSDPFAPQRATNFTLDWRFHLRLVYGNFNPRVPGPLTVGREGMPGYSYPRFESWRDYRFKWGEPGVSVFLLVPANSALKLFLAFDGPGMNSKIKRLGGRMQGYTQPSRCKAIGYNVSHGW